MLIWCRESEIWKFRLPRKKKLTGLLLEKTLPLHLYSTSVPHISQTIESLSGLFLHYRFGNKRSEMWKWNDTRWVNSLVIANGLLHHLGCTQFSVLFGCDCSNSSSLSISCQDSDFTTVCIQTLSSKLVCSTLNVDCVYWESNPYPWCCQHSFVNNIKHILYCCLQWFMLIRISMAWYISFLCSFYVCWFIVFFNPKRKFSHYLLTFVSVHCEIVQFQLVLHTNLWNGFRILETVPLSF